jgi:hypothetical protein
MGRSATDNRPAVFNQHLWRDCRIPQNFKLFALRVIGNAGLANCAEALIISRRFDERFSAP